jgi:hypothetical protein
VYHAEPPEKKLQKSGRDCHCCVAGGACTSICFSVTRLPSVTQLDFCSCAKQNNRTLLTLFLNDNRIGDVGAAALGEGIAVSCVARWLLPFFVVG